MARAHVTHEADCGSPGLRYACAVLLLALTGSLTGCGGGAEPTGGSGASVGGGPVGGGGINVGPVCATGGAAGGATVTWDAFVPADPTVTGYNVYYGTTSRYDFSFTGYASVENAGNTTTHNVSGLSSATRYFFSVTALAASGESDFSEEVCKDIS